MERARKDNAADGKKPAREISPEEAAATLGVHARTIRNLLAKKALLGAKVGGRKNLLCSRNGRNHYGSTKTDRHHHV